MSAQPAISSVALVNLDTVNVQFSGNPTSATAGDAANYTFSPSASITSVNYDASSQIATLVTSLSSGIYYELTVSNVKDNGGGTMSTYTAMDLVYNTYSGNGLVFTEIMYNDPTGPDAYEFVELYNQGNSDIELGGLKMARGATYTFPQHTMKAGDVVVIAKNVDSVKVAFGADALGSWNTNQGLNNSGEPVDLVNSMGDIIDEVVYDDGNGWETACDGSGPSLQLKSHRISSDSNDFARNWYADYSKSYPMPGNTTAYCTPGWLPVTHVAISEIRSENVDGVNTSNGSKVSVSGIVISTNFRSSGLEFFVNDGTGGIGLFESSRNWGYSVNIGDSIWLSGTVGQFNGLSQISSIDTVYKIANGSTPMPTNVGALGEETEGELIKLNGWTLLSADATWGSNKNYNITNGTDTVTLRIDRDTDIDGESIPSGQLNFTGIGTQFDNSSPYTSGYQILPRMRGDIERTTGLPSPTVSFAGARGTVSENAGTYNLQVSLQNPNSNPTTVEVYVSGGSGQNGTHYNFSSPHLVTFPANSNQTQNIIITILNNSDVDADRDVEFKFQNPTNDAVYGDSIFLLTIENDDLPFTDISEVTKNDATGVPVMLNEKVKIKGVVYGGNLRSPGLQFTVIDNTGGVGMIEFSKDFGYTVNESDEVILQGVVGFYNGLTQIQNLDTIIFNNDQKTLINPVVVTELNEETESELVKLERVWFVDNTVTTWPNNGNIEVTNGSDTFTIRIDREVLELAGQPTPTFDTMNITGLGNQFDASSPYDEGYQLFPRYASDVEQWMEPVSVSVPSFNLHLFPNPTNGKLHISTNAGIIKVNVLNIQGALVLTKDYSGLDRSASINLGELSQGVYLIEVQTELVKSLERIILE